MREGTASGQCLLLFSCFVLPLRVNWIIMVEGIVDKKPPYHPDVLGTENVAIKGIYARKAA